MSLQRGGISSAEDLLTRFPIRYENWRATQSTASLRGGEKALVEGVVTDVRILPRRRGRQLLAHLEDDEGGYLTARFFHVTPGLQRALAIGARLRLMGTVKFGNGWEMAHPKIQFADSAGEGKMQAIYGAAGDLSQDRRRRLIMQALELVPAADDIPKSFMNFTGGEWRFRDALSLVHLPPPDDPQQIEKVQNGEHPAWRRLRFDELLAHQIVLRAIYRRRGRKKAAQIRPPPEWDSALRAALPFTPTAAQQRAMDEIAEDLRGSRPMRRLLQGDVGSGKTLVAAFACLAAAKSGRLAVLMAPTEILAYQHYETLSAFFRTSGVQCELFVGGIRGAKRREALAQLRLGLSHIAIGTHALFYEEKNMPPVALAVIDEQHRFGVEQRAALSAAGNTHQLMMSATPIPRTLAMSAFADVDISVLDELPPGRMPVATRLVPRRRRDEVLTRIEAQEGAAYWVCPRIEESDDDLQDVFSLLEKVRKNHPNLSPEVLHGRLSAAEKRDAIDRFRAGKSRFLAATTVIEVGVDVPQADVMVVEHAERMGLSQLHQLRGRVGRGGRAGVCILLYEDDLSDEAKARLKILHETSDGFKVAEHDLRLRGPGEWLGTRQSGLPPFRVARLGEDADLIAIAGRTAEWLLNNDLRTCIRQIRRWIPRHRPRD